MLSKTNLTAPLWIAGLVIVALPAPAQTNSCKTDPTQAGCTYVPYYPIGAQVDLYFAQLADGGPAGGQRWQSSFLFNNPGLNSADVTLNIYDDNGQPLAIDLGAGFGVASSAHFTLDAEGAIALHGTTVGSSTSGGWAVAHSTSPLQATIIYTAFEGGSGTQLGTPALSVSAPATLPANQHWFNGDANTGIALANVYSDKTVTVRMRFKDASGNLISSKDLTLDKGQHTAFNVSGQYPDLANFQGSIHMYAPASSQATDFLAWAVAVPNGTVASLPPGREEWPQRADDAIRMAFLRIWNAGAQWNDWPKTMPQLLVDHNSDAVSISYSGTSTLTVTAATAELISDSPSELAFLIADELALATGFASDGTFSSNQQLNADSWAILFLITAGYDPYGALGALGKLEGASQVSGLVSGTFFPSSAFSTRLSAFSSSLSAACNYDDVSMSSCQDYLAVVHPNFPGNAVAAAPPRFTGVVNSRQKQR